LRVGRYNLAQALATEESPVVIKPAEQEVKARPKYRNPMTGDDADDDDSIVDLLATRVLKEDGGKGPEKQAETGSVARSE
jgi:hypothetical protein